MGATATRILGHLAASAPGPTLLLVGGIHGNEPAGVAAARGVLWRVAEAGGPARGEVLALSGNVGALAEGARYRVKDLNRQFTPENMVRLADVPESARDAEDAEQAELLALLDAAVARARGPVALIDLHTTSAPGLPFALLNDTPAQRSFAAALHVPALLGLETHVIGAISTHYGRRGCLSISVEGGQHTSQEARENLTAVIYAALAHLGLLPGALANEAEAAARTLRAAAAPAPNAASLPALIHVRSRHAIVPEDAFEMQPGFRNLAPVAAGTLLARDRRGEIRAAEDGVVILPLYQKLGSEGFFWGVAAV